MPKIPIRPEGFIQTASNPVIYGNTPDQTFAPDFSISEDGKGMMTGTVRFFYNCPYDKPPNNVVRAGASHPTVKKLLCNSVNTTIQSNNICYVEASYVGIEEDPAGVEWTLNTQTEDVPIENHPDFADPDKNWGTVTQAGYNTLGIPYWDTKNVVVNSDGEFGGFRNSESNREKGFVGVTAYKVPRATLSVSFYTAKSDLITDAVDSLAKAGSPPVGIIGAPAPKGGGEWFVTSVSVSQYSTKVFQVQMELTQSGPRGVNKYIYPDDEE